LKVATGAATLTAAPLARSAVVLPPGQPVTPDEIINLFEPLPGTKAVKILVPAPGGQPAFVARLNSNQRLFVASANKTYVLCEALRQIDAPDVVETLLATALELNLDIWSPGSPTFNPPDLQGIVSERTTLEAMILNSDNTATDMILKLAGADNVRAFIASAGLTQTQIPDSTRAFAAYLFGAKNYERIRYDALIELITDRKGIPVNPFLNNIQTFASSADDFVSYYSLALQGGFFEHSETLNEFRRILTLCDFIYLIPLPLGVSAYAKSGNVDSPNFHVRSIAGGMFFSDQWVYFSFIINWFTPNEDDPETVRQFFSAIYQALTLVKKSFTWAKSVQSEQ
jgi:beta-lactamase class A